MMGPPFGRPPARQRSPIGPALSLLALAAVFALGLRMPAMGPEERSSTSPDGSTLTLLSTTYGRRHRLAVGNGWQQLLLPLAPPGLRGTIGGRLIEHVAANPRTLVVWAHRDGSSRGEMRVTAVDSAGCEWESGRRVHSERSSAGERFGWALTGFPRRGRDVGLRFYQRGWQGEWLLLATFTVENPAAGRYPDWKPAPLPAQAEDGPLEVRLARLVTGLSARDFRRPAGEGEQKWTEAVVECREQGRPAPWAPTEVACRDATGNTLVPRSWSSSRDAGRLRLRFLGALCAEEPAWRVRMGFARTSGFPREETSVMEEIPTAPAGTVVRRFDRRTIRGANVTLMGVAGEGSREAEIPHTAHRAPCLQFRISPPLTGLTLFLTEVRDQRGRAVPVVSGPLPAAPGTGCFRIAPPPGARRLSLGLALHRRRSAEFLVRPERPGGNVAP